nr:MAG TPA: hypothetical protein [Caudoviricetes sp.]
MRKKRKINSPTQKSTTNHINLKTQDPRGSFLYTKK